jgi:hypothetical protein
MSPSPKFEPVSKPGTLHLFTSRLCAFEHAPPSSAASTTPTNTLLWIGGLGDGLLTVPYTHAIAQALPPSWRLAQPLLSSGYDQWGIRTLATDAAELRRCVAYFRTLRPAGRVVLMGHSTGCQDCMEYVVGPQNTEAASGGVEATEEGKEGEAAERDTTVDGIILQASVSDREALGSGMDKETLEASIKAAQELAERGEPDEVIPRSATGGLFGPAPVTARRWLSLTSPDHRGEDDFFSSDLSDERLAKTFGSWPKSLRLAFCYSGSDPFVPKSVDKEALVKKWEGLVEQAGGIVDDDSGVVPNAGHNLKGDPDNVVEDLVGRVVRFLGRVGHGSGGDLAARI